MSSWHAVPATEEEIEKAVVARARSEYKAFVNTFLLLLQLGRFLKDDPSLGNSGQWEEIPIPRQYADMEREVAMSLANPAQPFSARAKIGVSEYTIQTTQLPAAAPDHIVTARIASIREQNYRDGYTRRRDRVAKDLRKRHAMVLQLIAEHAKQNPTQPPPKQARPQRSPRPPQPAPQPQARLAAGGETPQQRSGSPPQPAQQHRQQPTARTEQSQQTYSQPPPRREA